MPNTPEQLHKEEIIAFSPVLQILLNPDNPSISTPEILESLKTEIQNFDKKIESEDELSSITDQVTALASLLFDQDIFSDEIPFQEIKDVCKLLYVAGFQIVEEELCGVIYEDVFLKLKSFDIFNQEMLLTQADEEIIIKSVKGLLNTGALMSDEPSKLATDIDFLNNITQPNQTD